MFSYKIGGKILLDHPLCYALTATTDVPAVYLQQFWQTVHKVPDTKDTIYNTSCFRTMLELVSHKENPEHVDDDDDKKKELTDTVSLPAATTSKDPHSKRRISSKYSHLPGALHRMCRRQGYMIKNMELKCVTTKYFWKTHKKVDRVLHEIVPQLAERAIYDLTENNLKPSIAATIIKYRDAFRSEVHDIVSQEFNAQAPKIIEELFKNYVQNNVIQVHPTTTTSTKTTSSAGLQQQLYLKIKRNNSLHNDMMTSEDDAPPEGEKRVKRHKTSKSLKSVRGSSSKQSGKDSTTYVSKQQQQQQEWDARVKERIKILRFRNLDRFCKFEMLLSDIGTVLNFFHMAQQIVPAAQLVFKFQGIRRCNNYAVLQSITFHKVPDTKDTIRFKLNTQEITYTVDMFRDALKLQLIIANLMEKYLSIPRRHDVDYHSIKDDTPLEYETVFVGVDVLMNQLQSVVSTQGTHRSAPRAHKTPTLTTASPQEKKRKQRAGETSDDRKRDEVAEVTILSLTLHKIALAAEAQENIAKFADSMINDDVNDSGTRIEPGSHKEYPENVNDDDEIEKEIKDDEIMKEETNDDVEKINAVVKEKDNYEGASGSMEFRNEKMQTPILTLTRPPWKDLSSVKTISEELTATVSPTTATSPHLNARNGLFHTR
ncbi:hypothetical protein Tco_0371007 [Tanacetum coccineum]